MIVINILNETYSFSYYYNLMILDFNAEDLISQDTYFLVIANRHFRGVSFDTANELVSISQLLEHSWLQLRIHCSMPSSKTIYDTGNNFLILFHVCYNLSVFGWNKQHNTSSGGGIMGARGGRGPPNFFNFFYYYYTIILYCYLHMMMNMVPPLLAFVSFCMLGLCFLWQKIIFTFKKSPLYKFVC